MSKIELTTDKTTVRVDPYNNDEQYLPDDVIIRFQLSDYVVDYIDIRREGDVVVVTSGQALQLMPRVSNVVTLKSVKRC